MGTGQEGHSPHLTSPDLTSPDLTSPENKACSQTAKRWSQLYQFKRLGINPVELGLLLTN